MSVGAMPGFLDHDEHCRSGEVGQHIDRKPANRITTPDKKGGGERHHQRPVCEGPSNECVQHGDVSGRAREPGRWLKLTPAALDKPLV